MSSVTSAAQSLPSTRALDHAALNDKRNKPLHAGSLQERVLRPRTRNLTVITLVLESGHVLHACICCWEHTLSAEAAAKDAETSPQLPTPTSLRGAG